MYVREGHRGTIEWNPTHKELAAQAFEETDGTGVPDEYELPDDAPIRLSVATIKDVRNRYDELVEEVHGGDEAEDDDTDENDEE